MEFFNVDIVTQLSRCEIVAMQVSRAIPIVLTVRKLDWSRSKRSFWTPFGMAVALTWSVWPTM